MVEAANASSQDGTNRLKFVICCKCCFRVSSQFVCKCVLQIVICSKQGENRTIDPDLIYRTYTKQWVSMEVDLGVRGWYRVVRGMGGYGAVRVG